MAHRLDSRSCSCTDVSTGGTVYSLTIAVLVDACLKRNFFSFAISSSSRAHTFRFAAYRARRGYREGGGGEGGGWSVMRDRKTTNRSAASGGVGIRITEFHGSPYPCPRLHNNTQCIGSSVYHAQPSLP